MRLVESAHPRVGDPELLVDLHLRRIHRARGLEHFDRSRQVARFLQIAAESRQRCGIRDAGTRRGFERRDRA